MATYEFFCKRCGITWEKDMPMNVGHIDECSHCGQKTPSLITGGSGGIIFKGLGFPSNDLKKEKEIHQTYKEVDEILPGKEEAEAIKKTNRYKKLVEGK
jgi:putative FmdB family regulatory protein